MARMFERETCMPNESQADHLKKWDMALAGAEANPEEPGIGDLKSELETAASGARAKIVQANQLKYQLQQTYHELGEIMDSGRKIFGRLVRVIKGRYGWDSEKLRGWGVQPQRPPQVSQETKAMRWLAKEAW